MNVFKISVFIQHVEKHTKVYKANVTASINDGYTQRRSKAPCILRAIQIYSVLIHKLYEYKAQNFEFRVLSKQEMNICLSKQQH